MITIKAVASLTFFFMSLIAGWWPLQRQRLTEAPEFPALGAFASGVFLGAGLLHFAHSAISYAISLRIQYPLALFIIGATFLILLWLEHVGRDYYQKKGVDTAGFAWLAVLILSLHSLFMGTALGLTANYASFAAILLAIIAHKWVESFALASYLGKSTLPIGLTRVLFIIFATMTPLGIIFSQGLGTTYHSPILMLSFNAIAAGTLLYLGTLHGLDRAVMVKQCCNLKHFTLVITGFLVMALIAVII